MLAKIAVALRPNFPVDVEALFHGSGNTRSALETILVYTPNIFLCFPGRTDPYTGDIREGVKHIMWCPDKEHAWGEFAHTEYEGVIADLEATYSGIVIEENDLKDEFNTIQAKRTHTRMQIALVEIGYRLNLNTWIAKNDQHIKYGDGQLIDLPGTISSLDSISFLPEKHMKDAAKFIDAIWFDLANFGIPMIFEVEHSTGVTPGLTRMQGFLNSFAMLKSSNFVIVAPDILKSKVAAEVSRPIFRELDAKFLPYSAVQHLYAIMQKYRVAQFVDYEFVLAFMEDFDLDSNSVL